MNNRGAVVERSCVRRKDLCARSEIVVYSAVTLTAVCVLVFARRSERSSEHREASGETLKATPPGAGGGEASREASSAGGRARERVLSALRTALTQSTAVARNASALRAAGGSRPAPSPRNGTTKHVSMIHVPRRDVSCVQLQICPLKTRKKSTHVFTIQRPSSSETRVLTRSRQLLVFCRGFSSHQAPSRERHAHASMPPHKTVDYSKWDNLDDSDDEDKPKADHVAEYTAATIAKRKQEEEEKRRQDAEKAGLDAAITAAAMASSMGNTEALDEMMAQTQAAAPLAPEMEKIIRSLPAAAQIAARASAATMVAAGPMAGGGKEPTLAELLKVQKITVDAEDPGLEDVREFFETADEAAAVEAAAERAAAITVAQMRERDVRSRPPARADVVEIG